jgi:hypothetical protein
LLCFPVALGRSLEYLLFGETAQEKEQNEEKPSEPEPKTRNFTFAVAQAVKPMKVRILSQQPTLFDNLE